MQVLQAPARLHELDGQPVEKLDELGASGPESEVGHRADEGLAEMPGPDVVDRHAGRQGVAASDDPSGQGEPSARADLRVRGVARCVAVGRLGPGEFERTRRVVGGRAASWRGPRPGPVASPPRPAGPGPRPATSRPSCGRPWTVRHPARQRRAEGRRESAAPGGVATGLVETVVGVGEAQRPLSGRGRCAPPRPTMPTRSPSPPHPRAAPRPAPPAAPIASPRPGSGPPRRRPGLRGRCIRPAWRERDSPRHRSPPPRAP